MLLHGVQNGLEAATSSLQAVQNAHKAEIAFIESEKETDMVAVKSTAVKRVKQLIAELDSLKGANAEGRHPSPCCLHVELLSLMYSSDKQHGHLACSPSQVLNT